MNLFKKKQTVEVNAMMQSELTKVIIDEGKILVFCDFCGNIRKASDIAAIKKEDNKIKLGCNKCFFLGELNK